MSQEARARILHHLRQRTDRALSVPTSNFRVMTPDTPTREQMLERFERCLTSVHGEVIHTPAAQWTDALRDLLQARQLKRLLLPARHAVGVEARAALADTEVEPMTYDRPIEDWQSELFEQVEVSLTSTEGGIAETGSLILWPDADQPRLMSLVPSIHIAVLDADRLYPTFQEAMQREQWATRMPTNVLLISGPSKTADIEQTLAYGVHGPRELIVLVRHP